MFSCRGLELDSKVQQATLGDRPPSVVELPSTILLDETAVVQHGEQFVLFAAVDEATREVNHLGVASLRNYLTSRQFFEEIGDLYGELPEVVITDGTMGYGAAFGRLRIRHVVRDLDVRNILSVRYKNSNAASVRSTPRSPVTASN